MIYFVTPLTLLEAFCFEAIFENLQGRKDTKFMDNFLAYVDTAREQYKELPFDELLSKAKNEIFEKMERDRDLKSMLLSYYRENEGNLPFRLE